MRRPPADATTADVELVRANSPTRIAVFAPSALVTVTIEDGGEHPGIHFHAGGQGVWVAHMAASLGAEVALSTVLGGESGRLLSVLLQADRVDVHAVAGGSGNGVYVHDRRSGKRLTVAQVPAPALERHELDQLYGVALSDGLECGVACLTAPQHPGVLAPSLYARLTGDLRRNGTIVVADLTGPALEAALTAGVDVLKLSEAELLAEGWAQGTDREALVDAVFRLRDAGARNVVASRGSRPAIALIRSRLLELQGPCFTAADPAGAGDAMVAGIAVSLARGEDLEQALAFGAAAGAINATRHGLGTGGRRQVEQLARRVILRPLAVPAAAKTSERS
jgi:1-phosphofructokinase